MAVLRDTTQGFTTSQFAAIQAVAPSLRVEVNPVDMRDAGGIERAVAAFAQRFKWRSDPRLEVLRARGTASSYPTLAARHKLPAIYFERFFADAGGLASEPPCQRRRGPPRGRLRRPHPQRRRSRSTCRRNTLSEYERLVINLKAAKALGLSEPLSSSSNAPTR